MSRLSLPIHVLVLPQPRRPSLPAPLRVYLPWPLNRLYHRRPRITSTAGCRGRIGIPGRGCRTRTRAHAREHRTRYRLRRSNTGVRLDSVDITRLVPSGRAPGARVSVPMPLLLPLTSNEFDEGIVPRERWKTEGGTSTFWVEGPHRTKYGRATGAGYWRRCWCCGRSDTGKCDACARYGGAQTMTQYRWMWAITPLLMR